MGVSVVGRFVVVDDENVEDNGVGDDNGVEFGVVVGGVWSYVHQSISPAKLSGLSPPDRSRQRLSSCSWHGILLNCRVSVALTNFTPAE